MTLRLLEFTISHYSERARWALDAADIPFERQVLVPGPHVLTVRRLGGRKNFVPMLVGAAEGPIQGSDRILDWAQAQPGGTALAPPTGREDDARAWEQRLDREIGKDLRRILYSVLMHEVPRVRALWCLDGPAWAPAFYAVMARPLLMATKRSYGITPGKVEASRARFAAVADALDARLQEGPYLMGERFCRVDLTAAALLAPLCRPPEHLVPWPADLPDDLVRFEAMYRERPFFQWVLHLYATRRHPAGVAG
jgi:glutathione S-transferase